eukprot:8539364-Prorocentrum_lima.AAC.1
MQRREPTLTTLHRWAAAAWWEYCVCGMIFWCGWHVAFLPTAVLPWRGSSPRACALLLLPHSVCF